MTVQQQFPIIIAVGYSVRALVEACWLEGMECVAVDHFGDADTRTFANGRWIELQLCERRLFTIESRQAIQSAVNQFEQAGKKAIFLLAGGMENLGEAVEQLREIAPVLGPTEEQRRALRDLDFLHHAASRAGLRMPRLGSSRPSDKGWLWKPFLSAGGLKIVRSENALVDSDSGYWQEFICGEQIGVSCVLDVLNCRILGATSNLDAADWAGPLEFIYRGSIGPIPLSAEHQLQIKELCNTIRERLGFCGWLQFDFIRDELGLLWLLECNPRWTAGMEVLLYSGEVNPVQEHLAAHEWKCKSQKSAKACELMLYAKAIVYAERPVNVSDDRIARIKQIEGVADLPHSPQLIESGHPIVTVRVGLKCEHASESQEDNRAMLLDCLRKRAEQVLSTVFD